MDAGTPACRVVPAVDAGLWRYNHTARLVPQLNWVLIAGGYGSQPLPPISTELYDPIMGRWCAGPDSVTRRIAQSSAILPGGDVLHISGDAVNGDRSVERFVRDGGALSIVAAPSVGFRHKFGAAVTLSSGQVLVVGGENAPSELFDGVAWRDAGFTLARHKMILVALGDGGALVAGGETDSGVIAAVQVFSGGQWLPAPPMLEARQAAAAVLLDNGGVLVTGGINDGGHTVKDELFVDGGWVAVASMTIRRRLHDMVKLKNGNVFVAGGFSPQSAFLDSTELYDPLADQWLDAGRMLAPRVDHTATLLPDGRVLIFGAFMSNPRAEIYDPATRSFTPAP
jgi:hypothetical protein